MQITASAISLNVDDVTASATFVKQHFGFVVRLITCKVITAVIIH